METDTQIFLITKESRYAVPDHPISVPSDSTPDKLNQILKDLLKSENSSLKVDNVNFDFLIKNVFLVTSLSEHLSEEGCNAELVEVEYILKQAPPTPEEDIQQEDFISCVRRNGKYILTGSYDESIQLYSVGEDEPIVVVPTGAKVKCVEWLSLDMKQERAVFVSGGFDQTIQMWTWNLDSNQVDRVCLCKGHSEVVLSCANSPHNQLFASGSWDANIKLWSSSIEDSDLSEETGGIPHTKKNPEKIPTRIPRMTLGGHREAVSRVIWLSSRVLASSSWDHSVRLWDVEGEARETRCILSSHAFHDLSASHLSTHDDVTPHSLLLTASSDNKVRIYDTRAQEALVQSGFRSHTGWLSSVAWAPHRPDQFITGSIDGTVKLWDLRNSKAPLYDLMGHEEMVTGVDWPSKDYIVSCGADAALKIYKYR